VALCALRCAFWFVIKRISCIFCVYSYFLAFPSSLSFPRFSIHFTEITRRVDFQQLPPRCWGENRSATESAAPQRADSHRNYPFPTANAEGNSWPEREKASRAGKCSPESAFSPWPMWLAPLDGRNSGGAGIFRWRGWTALSGHRGLIDIESIIIFYFPKFLRSKRWSLECNFLWVRVMFDPHFWFFSNDLKQ